ncbi:cytochrome P450 [Mycena leptocephala]|nr:cytochrome P450 [Mycena leptocephala]
MHVLLFPIVLGVITVTYYFLNPGKKRPPGPPALPIIGNLFQMPKDHEWKTYAQWAKKYGDCVYIQVLGQPIVILHSLAAAHDLLNQRSAIYSSRPRLVMAGELVGFNQSIPLMSSTPRLLSLRRLIHKELTVIGLQKYWPLHEDESRILIEKVLLDPGRLLDYIRHYSGSVILRVTYGYKTAPQDDKYLGLAEKVIAAFSDAAKPGAWAVDILPWLRHLPSWLPGMTFKRKAAIWRQMHMDVVEGPFHWALNNKDSAHLVQPNFLSTILAEWPTEFSDEDADLLLWGSASLFGGGADTVHISYRGALSTFFLAMALADQLSDRPLCHMSNAHAGGLPHLLIKDDIYKNYHLPAGSIVMVNVWSILRDPVVFPNPQDFHPAQVTSSIFGFGRRCVSAACNISDPVDIQGSKISKDVELRPGMIRHPEKFRCSITARSKIAGKVD